MAEFMAHMIITKRYEYTFVVKRRPDLKEGIDKELKACNHAELIA